MKAKNVEGLKILIEGSYFETSCLVEMVSFYIAQNPNAPDLDIAKEWERALRNPVVE